MHWNSATAALLIYHTLTPIQVADIKHATLAKVVPTANNGGAEMVAIKKEVSSIMNSSQDFESIML